MNTMNFSRLIIDLREKLRWSQNVLSMKSGVSQGSVSRIESGKQKNLTTSTIIKLLRAFFLELKNKGETDLANQIQDKMQEIDSGFLYGPSKEVFNPETGVMEQPAKYEAYTSPTTDTEQLALIVDAMASNLERTEKTIEPHKKAELIALLCDVYSNSGRKVDVDIIERFLALIAS